MKMPFGDQKHEELENVSTFWLKELVDWDKCRPNARAEALRILDERNQPEPVKQDQDDVRTELDELKDRVDVLFGLMEKLEDKYNELQEKMIRWKDNVYETKVDRLLSKMSELSKTMKDHIAQANETERAVNQRLQAVTESFKVMVKLVGIDLTDQPGQIQKVRR